LDRPSDHLKPALDRPVERYQLRQGSYFPSFWSRPGVPSWPWSPWSQEAYVNGSSTRKVDQLVEPLGLRA
jgi:hypothetical protein